MLHYSLGTSFLALLPILQILIGGAAAAAATSWTSTDSWGSNTNSWGSSTALSAYATQTNWDTSTLHPSPNATSIHGYATTAPGASPSSSSIPSTSSTCAWMGHCLGDQCQTMNDCDQNWICVSGVCAVSGSGGNASASGNSSSVISPAVVTSVSTSTTTLSGYNTASAGQSSETGGVAASATTATAESNGAGETAAASASSPASGGAGKVAWTSFGGVGAMVGVWVLVGGMVLAW